MSLSFHAAVCASFGTTVSVCRKTNHRASATVLAGQLAISLERKQEGQRIMRIFARAGRDSGAPKCQRLEIGAIGQNVAAIAVAPLPLGARQFLANCPGVYHV